MSDAVTTFSSKPDSPLAIVTTAVDGERAGCLVGYWTQCSIEPARFLVCISKKNHTIRLAEHAEVIALHLVPSKASEIAWLFGAETGDEIDKFAHCEWVSSPGGVPVLASCPSHAVCRVLERFDVGDHLALLVQIDEIANGPEEDLFTVKMATGHHIEPGHPA